MSEKSRRNYPFIGRIYTAEQIDNLIGSIDLSDYYTKTDIDGMLDIIETAIDAKQDELTAGDNITIENNVISAIDTVYSAGDNITITNNVISAVGGGSDSIKLIPTTWQNVINDTEINFYLVKVEQNSTEFIILIKNVDGTNAESTPLMGTNNTQLAICGMRFNKNYSINFYMAYSPPNFQISRSTTSLYKNDGTVIDSSNIDTVFDTDHFTTTIIMDVKAGNDHTNIMILSGQPYIAFYNGYGIYKGSSTNVYNAIKNDNPISLGGTYLSVSTKNLSVSNIVNVYKLEFPTTN